MVLAMETLEREPTLSCNCDGHSTLLEWQPPVDLGDRFESLPLAPTGKRVIHQLKKGHAMTRKGKLTIARISGLAIDQDFE